MRGVIALCIACMGAIAGMGILLRYEDRQQDQVDKYVDGALVLRDPVNGCQYLYRGGITPRLNADGTQVCNKGDVQYGR